MKDDELLKNEKVEKALSPHPLSFMRYQALSIFLIVWGILLGWFVNFSEDFKVMFVDDWLTITVWALVLLVVGVIASIITIRWRIFILYLGVFLGGFVLIIWQDV